MSSPVTEATLRPRRLSDETKPGPPPPRRGSFRVPRWQREQLLAASLIVVPFALFVSIALSGHVLLPGDDLTQNYPLRVLVGSELRHGHLPLWDPYLWSGAPLLAGFNAGALYPMTFLFAVLPASLAWSIGLAAVYATAGTGLYFFLRRRSFAAESAWLAAVVFSASGFMAAHLNHLGLIEGMSWVGWVLLALDHLARPVRPGERTVEGGILRARVRWSALLGLFGGLVVLAGDPRAVTNVALVAVVFGAWLVWRSRGNRVPVLASIAAGGVVAALLGAGQLLPGLHALSMSQRSASNLVAFGAGSLTPPFLTLLGVPFLLGGFATYGFPQYAANYNLAEVTGYLGLLPLAGAFGVLGALVAHGARRLGARQGWWRLGARQGSRSPAEGLAGASRASPVDGASDASPLAGASGVPRDASGPATGAWAWLALIGLLLALGNQTPLGHLLVHIPLYSGERLQSRNLGVIDVALAVLFCIWVDRYVPRTGARSAWRGVVRGAALVAPGTVFAVLIAAAVAPGTMRQLLLANNDVLGYAWPYLVYSGVLAVAVIALLFTGERMRRFRLRAVVALVLVDVAFFAVNAIYGWNSTSALRPDAGGTASLAGQLAPNERFVVYDPNLTYPGYVVAGPGTLRVPDLNVLSHVSSVQGYGSFVAANYENATGAHDMGNLEPSMLAGPLPDQLDLRVVLVAPAAAHDLHRYLTQPRWRYQGEIAGLLAYRNTDHLAPAYIAPAGSAASAGGRTAAGSVLGSDALSLDGSATFEVSAPSPLRLIRSATWYPGWTATLVPVGGGQTLSRPATAAASGLLQSVFIPAGRWRVTFTYHPPWVPLGLTSSGLGVLVALGGLLLARRGGGRPGRIRAARDAFVRLLETNPRARRLWRYTVTSVVATVVSEVTLLVTFGTRTLGAVAAAVVANLAGAIPSYPMSRYWIWPEADRRHGARQAAGYWLVSLASLVVSSAATGVAAEHAPAGGGARLVVVGAAYIATLVVLWLAKLAVYQLVLFRPPRATGPTPVSAGPEHQRAG